MKSFFNSSSTQESPSPSGTFDGAGTSKTNWSRLQTVRGLQHASSSSCVGRGAGLNTIYTDVDIEPGDVVVVDVPYTEDMPATAKYTGGADNDWGFAVRQRRKGVPSEKQMLVVRPIPVHGVTKNGFARRGQILGKCVKGAPAGSRFDVVLGTGGESIDTPPPLSSSRCTHCGDRRRTPEYTRSLSKAGTLASETRLQE